MLLTCPHWNSRIICNCGKYKSHSGTKAEVLIFNALNKIIFYATDKGLFQKIYSVIDFKTFIVKCSNFCSFNSKISKSKIPLFDFI